MRNKSYKPCNQPPPSPHSSRNAVARPGKANGYLICNIRSYIRHIIHNQKLREPGTQRFELSIRSFTGLILSCTQQCNPYGLLEFQRRQVITGFEKVFFFPLVSPSRNPKFSEAKKQDARVGRVFVMALSMINWYICAVAIPGLILTILTIHKWSSINGGPRFPGPRQFPFVGRVHDLPKYSMWLKFKEWTDTYGPIYETSMMGQRFIIIADEGIAQELLIKKSNSLAGRMQIRALLDHRASPVYLALQDRTGMNLT